MHHNLAATTDPSARRYDLDWLLVAAFAVLIFYHVGMLYVTWGFHVKSAHAGPAAEWLMRLMNPWRLPLLFFISGVALRFLSDARPLATLAGQRFARLGVPVVFGMAVVVAPQAYFELVAKGEFTGSFLSFYPQYLNPGSAFSIVTPTWNHLWYVVYILVYSLLLTPLARPLSRLMAGPGAHLTDRLFRGPRRLLAVLALLALPQVAIDLVLADRFPTTHNLVADWATHAQCLTVFVLGFALAKDSAFWAAVDRGLLIFAAIAAALTVAFATLWLHWADVRDTVTASPALSACIRGLRQVAAWATVFTFFGLAQRYLNRPSRALRYATEAVFPWYILHQTILIAAAVWLAPFDLPALTEALLVALSVTIGCALGHELIIRRIRVLRPLFGLRLAPRPAPSRVAAGSAAR